MKARPKSAPAKVPAAGLAPARQRELFVHMLRIRVLDERMLKLQRAGRIGFVGTAAVNVAEVVVAKVSLDSGNLGFGLLVGASGLGLTLGSLWASAALERFGMPSPTLR